MASTEPTQTEPVSSTGESRTEADEPIQIHQVSASVVTGTESYRDPLVLPKAINPWRFCARRDARCTDSAEPSASTPYYPDGGESMAADPAALSHAGSADGDDPQLPATQSPSVPDHQPVVSDSESEGDVDADIEPAQGRSPISAAKTAAQEALDGFWHDDRLLSASCRWSSLPPRDTGSGYERRSELTMTVRGRGFEQPEAWAFTEAYLEANLYLDYAVSGVYTVAEEWRSPAAHEQGVSRPDRFENTVTFAPFTSQYQPAHPEVRFDRIKPGEQLEGAVRVDLSRAQLNRRLERARSYLDDRAGPSELPPQPFGLEFELFGSDRCERVQTALATMVRADEPLFLRFALADEGTAVKDEDYSLGDDDSPVAGAGDRVLSILFLLGTSSITHRFEYLASIPEDLTDQVRVFTWQQGLGLSETERFVRDAETALAMDVPEIVSG